MADRNVFQTVGQAFVDFADWVVDTFSDAAVTAEIFADLGLDHTNPATPAPLSDDTRSKMQQFAAKQDVDELALIAIVPDLINTVETVSTFIEAAVADGVDPWTVFWMLFKVWVADVLRANNPSAYALCALAGLLTEEPETLAQLDPAPLMALVRGETTAADGEAWVQRISLGAGLLVVVLANVVDAIGGAIDATYGWDPEPGEAGAAAEIAARTLTVVLDADVLGGVRPALTLAGVPPGHGGPGLFLSTSVGFQFPVDVGETTYTFELTGAGQFGMLIPFRRAPVQFAATADPTIRLGAEPRRGSTHPTDNPFLLIGTTGGTRLQIGALAWGVEVRGNAAAFRLALKKGLFALALGQGDSFLRQLPGGNVEVPFELAMVADTASGVRLEGGTGLRVNLPIAATIGGVFTIQFIELELRLDDEIALDLVGGFSLTLGPFAASIDRIGMRLAFSELAENPGDVGKLVKFLPPKGIGLVLDIASVVKGGGYLFIDAERGEYAGALELKFLNFSIKAIGLLSTKRPDGSEGWSLLLFVFGQFNIHIYAGIFWTGLGGMIGLHHRADVDALSAGIKTGALDDILFPANPVADAPRIINRYRTLFPAQPNSFLVGPMAEFSFSTPPIVYVRLGLIFDIRNALGGGSAALSKIILLGQVLVQVPPRDTGAPAVVKMLIDVVGFYDADTQFLMIRARLRDSGIGISPAKIDVGGELMIAIQFGSEGSFVLSAGGFHPRYEGLPARVPKDLDRLKVGFNIGIVKMTIEVYFAVTPNSVQVGVKAAIKADFGIAGIEAALSIDALFDTARGSFRVDVEFRAKVKAFGRTLAAVKVTGTLEGPGEWRLKGEFSFSILWWDKTVPFDERWGTPVAPADAGTADLGQALRAELDNPDNLTIEAPAANPLALFAARGELAPAHPLSAVAIRQRLVPFDLEIDRIGTRRIAGGARRVGIERVAVNDQTVSGPLTPTTEQFARGQYLDLPEEERIAGKVFERYPNGVAIGAGGFVTAEALASEVTASFETVRLDPQPSSTMWPWLTTRLQATPISYGAAARAATLGAAARSERARATIRRQAPDQPATVSVQAPPTVLATPDTLVESATLTGTAATNATVAAQLAHHSGLLAIEAFELAGVVS